MVLFSHTNEIEIPELADAKTNPPKNLKDHGTTPPVGTHPSSSYSLLEYTSVALAEPPPCPLVEAGDIALQASPGDLLDVRLLGDDNMLFSVYQDWVHKNPGEHLDDVIT